MPEGAAQAKSPRTIDMLAWMPDSTCLLFLADNDLYSIAANGKGLQYICSGIDFILPGPAGQLLAGDGKNLLGLSLLTGATFPLSEKTPAAFNCDMPAGKGLRRASWSLLSNTAYYGSTDGYIMSYEASTGKLTAVEKGLDPQVTAVSSTGSERHERLVFWTATPTAAGQIRIRNLQPAASSSASGSASSLSFAPALPSGRSPVWLAPNEIAYVTSTKGNHQLALAKVSPEKGAALTHQSAFAFQTIQLAAYLDPAEAAAFVSMCRPLCAPYPLYVVEAEVNKTKWYRVRVGIFKNKTGLTLALDHILPAMRTAAAWDGKYFIDTAANDFGWLCPAPDGSFLIFSLMNAVYRYNKQDQSLVCLYEPAYYAPENKTNAILSPDGEKIAFVDESGRLKVMSACGDQPVTILNQMLIH